MTVRQGFSVSLMFTQEPEDMSKPVGERIILKLSLKGRVIGRVTSFHLCPFPETDNKGHKCVWHSEGI